MEQKDTGKGLSRDQIEKLSPGNPWTINKSCFEYISMDEALATIAEVSIENEEKDALNFAAPVKNLKMRFEKLFDIFQVLGMNLSKWFDAYECPQITADTFKRPVILLTSSPRVYRTTRTRF
ncbi:hypothetical protein MFLAVUS_007193 [Mucor flavus]|uniref:Uncharacterized protein n=1 Tax=Mucor flavus TaxID=439312 RepID=A0ABP9Z3Q0_9FUNG